MKIYRFFEHSENPIKIKLEDKSLETWNFTKKFLDVLDFNTYMENSNLYQVVARSLDDIVGVSIFKMKDGKIHINYSAVVEEKRSRGLNVEMTSEIEKIAKENNVDVITTNVRESNPASINSYLKSGFKINTNYSLSYPDGEKKIALFKRL